MFYTSQIALHFHRDQGCNCEQLKFVWGFFEKKWIFFSVFLGITRFYWFLFHMDAATLLSLHHACKMLLQHYAEWHLGVVPSLGLDLILSPMQPLHLLLKEMLLKM